MVFLRELGQSHRAWTCLHDRGWSSHVCVCVCVCVDRSTWLVAMTFKATH